MSIYALNLPTTVTTIAAPAYDLKAAAANSPKIMQLDVMLGQSVSPVVGIYGFGRPANDGSVAQTGATAVQSDDPVQPGGQTTCAIQWSVPPTQPVQFLRRSYLPAVLQAAIIWTWPRGLGVLATRGLVLWSLNAAVNPSPVAVTVILDE